MAGDACFQRGAFPIAHRFGIEHMVGHRDGGGGRPGGGLAIFHMDNAAPLRGKAVGQTANGHGMKRRDFPGHYTCLAWQPGHPKPVPSPELARMAGDWAGRWRDRT